MKTPSQWPFNSRRWKSSQTIIRCLAIAASILSLTLASYGQDSLGQVTTYAALTAKNTSAGLGSSLSVSTGASSENVSKISIASQLAPASSARIFVHLPVWFGTSEHQDVGYSSADAAQVHQQVADILSRGISGVIVDWHGPNDFTDQAALLVMQEAESHSGDFEFALEEDAQVFAHCAATSGCDLAAKAVSDLTYLQSTYTKTSKYMSYQGRPVIFLHGMEAYRLDWNKIHASLPGNPVLVFRPAAVVASNMVDAIPAAGNTPNRDFKRICKPVGDEIEPCITFENS